MTLVDRPVRPDSQQLAVWRMFLRAHAHVTRRLEADLMAEHRLPLTWYDVLLQLAEAPDRRLRMTDLADRVLLSRSGLSRLVDRMVRAGLVCRERVDSDRRGMNCVLAEEGYQRLRSAAPTHLRGIDEYAVGRLSRAELATLGPLLERFLTA